ncbi:hypothetical protein CP532_1095 [Ophiocordyceps camponoti-leonardi (nom. inval.)]|nr:hypothetical protein CP532_1095 [Ophiocordyceps camponoti-leonardi (nom. inval.)]
MTKLIVLKCTNCDTALGTLDNEWTQLGKNYITSVQDAEHLVVTALSDVRHGPVGTLMEGCQVQVAACAECGFSLGQKCLNCPADHSLKDGQVIFRITSVHLRLASDLRRKIAPNIKQVLDIKKVNDGQPPKEQTNVKGNDSQPSEEQPSSSPSTPKEDDAPPDRPLLQIQTDLEAHRQQIGHIACTGNNIVSSFQTAITRVNLQISQLNQSVDNIRSDVRRQHDAFVLLESKVADARKEEEERACPCEAIVARLDKKLQDTEMIVTEMRQALQKSQSESESLRQHLSLTREELDEARVDAATVKAEVDEAKNAAHESLALSREYAREVSSLRREVKQLRAERQDERILSQPAAASSFPSHELDILTSSISKIGNRASQIESLQMEFDLFRTRLQRLEAARADAAHPSRSVAATASAAAHDDDDDDDDDDMNEPSGYDGGTFRRKRTFMGRDDARGGNGIDRTSHKRAALSMSDHDSGVSTGYSRAGDPCRSSSSGRGKAASLSGPRRSRGGEEDYAALRRESWSGRD